MKPKAFDYYRPTTVRETLELLEQYGDDGKLLAGGQSLIPMMNFRLVQPLVLIDINRVEELNHLTDTEEGAVFVGATVRERRLEQSVPVMERYPLLAQALPYIGHLAIRNRGTIGGSLVQADPSGELPLATVMLDGILHVQGSNGVRQVPAEEFFMTYLTVDVDPAELLIGVEYPKQEVASWAFEEYAQRRGDFALVSAAVGIRLDQDGRVEFARFGVGGANPTPTRIAPVEEALLGQVPTEKLIQEVMELAATEVEPDSDVHASADYRRQLVRALGHRAIFRAIESTSKAVLK